MEPLSWTQRALLAGCRTMHHVPGVFFFLNVRSERVNLHRPSGNLRCLRQFASSVRRLSPKFSQSIAARARLEKQLEMKDTGKKRRVAALLSAWITTRRERAFYAQLHDSSCAN